MTPKSEGVASMAILGSGVMAAEDSVMQLLASSSRSLLEKTLYAVHSL